MKIKHCISMITFCGVANAQALDPTANFKNGLLIEAGDKILKWQADLNGDGKNDLFYALKSDSEESIKNLDPPSWDLYLSNSAGTDYLVSPDLKEPNGSYGGALLVIDPLLCFVGQITELGRRGIVTVRSNHPREGTQMDVIYAYTMEDGYLKKTELARYAVGPNEGNTPNALLAKYLADGKRTVVTPVEITP